MRITLVDNVLLERTNTGYQVDLQPHLGLISLIAVLRQSGHTAVLHDPKLDLVSGETRLAPGFYAGVAERIIATNPNIVGFTSLGCNFVCTLKIAEHVRRRLPSLPIVLGGPHASILDREILERYTQFDLIVRNEAEHSIGDALDALGGSGALSSTLGTTYRSNGRVIRTADGGPILDLDALPFPAYDAYPIDAIGPAALRVDAGRGCPFGCTFCSTAGFFGRRYRLKSADRLVGELDRLAAEYGIRRFALTHDLFTVDKRKVREFCHAVSGRGYSWNCSARMDCVDEELLAQMRDAGCTSIYYGVETGSARLQPVVGKHLDLALYHPTIGASLRLGIKPIASFITGYPNEILADQADTLALIGESIERYPSDLDVHLHLLTPEPGTGLFAQYESTLAYDGHITDFNFPPLETDDADVMAADPTAFVCHHYFASGIERGRNIEITEAYRALYSLGPHLLRALAREYSGGFPAMIIDYGRFSRTVDRDCDDRALSQRLLAFVVMSLGRAHPLADAVKYLLAFKALRPDSAPRVGTTDATQRVRLARCIVALDEMRDGAEILRRVIAGRDPLEEPLSISCFLLVAAPDLRARSMFAIDRVTYEIAAALQSSRLSAATLQHTWRAPEYDARLWTLRMLGALVDDSSDTTIDPSADARPQVVAAR